MTALAIFILLVQAVVLAIILVRDTMSTRREALTMKSVFLGGFLLFQTASGLYTLFTGDYDKVIPSDIGMSAFIYAVISSIFITLTLWFYGRDSFASRMASRSTRDYEVSDGGLIFMSVGALGLAILLRDILGVVPVLGVLTDMLSTGAFCAALAAVGWAWARRPFNVGTNAALILIGGATAALLLNNAFSRRGLVAAVLATIWAGYFARWRFGYRPTLVVRALVIGVLGLVLVLFQSATRGEKAQGGTVTQYLEAFTKVQGRDLTDAALGMVSGQFAGANSMWLIETVPHSFDYWPLHSLRYFVTQPIPRVIWAGKPWSLGNEMVLNAGITGVKKDEFSLGPGIVGHLVVDFPYVAIPLYAFLIGLALRYMDDRAALHPGNPFVIIPLGAATAQVLAFPRGELGLFAFNAVAWITGAMLALAVFGFIVRRRVVEQVDAEVDEDFQECEDSGARAEESDRSPVQSA